MCVRWWFIHTHNAYCILCMYVRLSHRSIYSSIFIYRLLCVTAICCGMHAYMCVCLRLCDVYEFQRYFNPLRDPCNCANSATIWYRFTCRFLCGINTLAVLTRQFDIYIYMYFVRVVFAMGTVRGLKTKSLLALFQLIIPLEKKRKPEWFA